MAKKSKNVNHCKFVAEELEKYVNGEYFRCPECGEIFAADACECGSDEEPEQLSAYDWLDGVLDYEFRIDRFVTLKSATFLVTFGGPTITVDTATKTVELRWCTESASYPISSDAAKALEDAAQELYECI